MYDVDRVLRGGGFLWIDHFFCQKSDLEGSFSPVFKKLSYRILKWSVEDKADASGVKNGCVSEGGSRKINVPLEIWSKC